MIGSPFRHAACEMCWALNNPWREPVRLIEPEEEKCCWCGARTLSGIYVRAEPRVPPCEGKHD